MPSQTTMTRATSQPSMACGLPSADMRSGIVMNGPTPIMLVMLSAVAPSRPKRRGSRGSLGVVTQRVSGAARGGGGPGCGRRCIGAQGVAPRLALEYRLAGLPLDDDPELRHRLRCGNAQHLGFSRDRVADVYRRSELPLLAEKDGTGAGQVHRHERVEQTVVRPPCTTRPPNLVRDAKSASKCRGL